MTNNITPFDLLSGKVVRTTNATYWFKEPGNNMQSNGNPIWENLHREDDLPAAEWKDGDLWWLVDGKRNRENGPAIISQKAKKWYKNDMRHRDDGPAVMYKNGMVDWYINGNKLTEEEFNEYVRNKPI